MKYPLGEYADQPQIEEDKGHPSIAENRNEYREVKVDWKQVATTHARIAPLAGRELWQAKQAESAATHQINFRYFPGLTTLRHRIRLGNRVFNLASALDLDNQQYEHECLATEVELKKGEQK